ncbi:MAG: ureidoglycolate lyase [Anaerolineales bacterium]
MRTLAIQNITRETFAPYGTVIDYNEDLEAEGVRFRVLLDCPEPTGWRMATLKVRAHEATHMEHHDTTQELFAPVKGVCVMLVHQPGQLNEEAIAAFLLDRPVSVGPGVWHEVFTLSEWSTILIAENYQFTGGREPLSHPFTATLAW